MNKILFDCDNTMGLPQKDVDDGLTLLYLLGRRDVELKGITSTFGNGTLEEANQVTKQMLEELGAEEIPFYSGAKDETNIDTPAANFLVEAAKEYKGEISVLATGPLTNLKAAYKKDPHFFTYLKEIIVMGGITEPLYFGDKEVEELNFSCDPEATKLVLDASVPVTVATGNLCLQAFFGSKEWQQLQDIKAFNYKYIYNYIKEWYSYGVELINKPGFYMWDLVAALYVTNSNLYDSKYYELQSEIEDLKEGKLILSEITAPVNQKQNSSGIINIPFQIKDIAQFKNLIFSAWNNF